MSAASSIVDDGDLENRSISELVSILRTAFRTADFDRVEEVLVAKEVKWKKEIENKNKECELLKSNYEFLRLDKLTQDAKLEQFKMDHKELERLKGTSEKLKKKEEELQVLKELIVKVNEDRKSAYEKEKKAVDRYEKLLGEVKKTEQNDKKIIDELKSKNSELECAKKAVELELEIRKKKIEELGKKYVEMGNRVSQVEDSYRNKMLKNGEPVPGSGKKVAVVDRRENQKGGKKSAVGSFLEISDGDDDLPIPDVLVKRKRDLCLDDLEYYDPERDDEENPLTFRKSCAEKVGVMLETTQHGSPANLGFKSSPSFSTNDSKKVITSSRTSPATLRQCEQQVGVEYKPNISQFKSATYRMDSSSKDRSIKSESGDNRRSEHDSSHPKTKGQGNRSHKKWECEADMLAAFEENDELCMEAVCALHRQSKLMAKSSSAHLSSRHRGFKDSALREKGLAFYMINKDPEGKLNRSVKELTKYDTKGLSDCRRIAKEYSSQLFEIYKNKEDQFFSS